MFVGTAAALVTALTLGANNVLAAVAARRYGTLATTVVSLSLALLILLVVVVAAGLEVPVEPAIVLQLAALAVFAAVGYLGIYEGLRLGPVAVVSPITATSGAVTTVLAAALLGERPTPLQWLSIPLLVIGALAASVVVDRRSDHRRTFTRGAFFAMIGVMAGSISNVGLATPIRDVGAVEAITVQRVFTVLLLGGWLFATTARVRSRPVVGSQAAPRRALAARDWLILPAIGVLDAVGFVAFALGLAVAPAWLVGLVSQSGRIAASWAGVTLFRERVTRTQWIGTGLIIVGIVGVAVGEATGR